MSRCQDTSQAGWSLSYAGLADIMSSKVCSGQSSSLSLACLDSEQFFPFDDCSKLQSVWWRWQSSSGPVCLPAGRVTIDHIFFLVRSDRGASGSSVWFSKRCSPGTEELFLLQCVCVWTAIWSCLVGLSACCDPRPLSLGLFHWQYRGCTEGLRSSSVSRKQSAVENE